MKKEPLSNGKKRYFFSRAWKIMKLCGLLCLVFTLNLSASVYSQSHSVSLDLQNVTLEEFIEALKKQTGVSFLYNASLFENAQRVNVKAKEEPMSEVLSEVLGRAGFAVDYRNEVVVITRSNKTVAAPQQAAKIVKGRVTDEKGEPLPGVSIILKGTTRGVATDVNGYYTLSYPAGKVTLVISYVGYKTQELAINGREVINVSLVPDSEQMEEVVVTGYQTISKERATGAYAIVNAQTLEQKPTANLSEALNGLVPGLAVQSSTVDGEMRFLIRGRGTLQDSQTERDPLIVVDGFPISGYSDSNDPFATINPNDVESVTVLKDAAATSIYGARAANGVIVITTKKGKSGSKLDISADAYWSVSSRADLDYAFNMASAENQFRFEELMHYYEPINLTGMSDPYLSPSARRKYMSSPYALLFERDGKGNISENEYNARKQELLNIAARGMWEDDLQEYIFRRMVHQQYNVALRGATERLNYAFSASFDDEKNYMQGNGDQRILLNLASSAKLTKNLTFNLAINTTFDKRRNNGTSISEVAEWLSPWTRLVDDNGNFTHVATASTVYEPILHSEYAGKTPADWTYNPVVDREYKDDIAKTMNYRVQGGFDYETTWGLNLSAKGQYEQRRYTRHTSYSPESFFVRDLYNTYSELNIGTGMYTSYFPTGGVFTDSGNTYESYNLRGQVDYNLNLDKHALSVLAGSEIISATTEVTPTVTRYGFNEYTNSVLTSPDYVSYRNNIFGVYSRLPFEELGTLSTREDRFFSVYANAAYTYNDRYSLTASFRTDASNFQAEEVRKKFSPFWSVGASWLVSQENFMSQTDWIDQLKLRVSYGIAGVAAGKSGTSSVTTLQTYPGNIVFSANDPFNTIAARGNNTLTWEKSRTVNVGLDVALFGNKLGGSIEFYNKYSYDVLSNATVPAISQGTTSAKFNNAEILNRGVELSVNTNLPVAGDLSWKGTLNYSFNRNEVKKFHMTTSFPAFNPGFVEGYPIDLINVLQPAGYTPEGFIILQGKDGEQDIILDYETSHQTEQILRNEGQTIEENNWAYYLGTSTPKHNLSFSNAFSWKGLTLSFMITGRFGYYVYRNDFFNPVRTNMPSYSKRLDEMFQVYDEGYANQTGYSALPLYNDDNYEQYIAGYGYMYAGNAAMSFRNNYINGNHIRLNEVYLGYELPERWMSRQGVFSRVNVYARATNLGLIWSANGKMDPDYMAGSLKPMPTFMFGLKLGFKNWK